MSEIVVDQSQNGILLVHPFKDKLPDVEEFCKANNEVGVVNTINSFCNKVKSLSEKYSLQIDPNCFKGDALELLVEYIIKSNYSDNRIGIYDYSPIDFAEDYGVDGYGIGENGNPATVQVKFRAGDCILTANIDHLAALKTIYGVDIDETNVKECKERLSLGSKDKEVWVVLDKNIICADALDKNHKGWKNVGYMWSGIRRLDITDFQ